MKTETTTTKWAHLVSSAAARLSGRAGARAQEFGGIFKEAAEPNSPGAQPLSFGPFSRPAATTPSSDQAGATRAAAAPPPPAYDPTHIPTLQEVFGGSPFVPDPQGHYMDGNTGELRTYSFRPMYFATEAAAAKIAGQLGGTVVQRNSIVNAYFNQKQPNQMILLPNGREVNAGIIADFYNHGYPQSYIDRLIAHEIDPEGGYSNLATPVTTVRNGAVQPGAVSKTTSA